MAKDMLALQGEDTKYIGVDALINQPTLDPRMFRLPTSWKRRTPAAPSAPTASRRCNSPICSSATVASARLVNGIEPRRQCLADVRSGDVQAWAYLGLHLAEKTARRGRSATYRVAGGEEIKQAAIGHLTRRAGYWTQLSPITRPIYRDMKLTHYNGNSFDANPDNLFHWALIRTKSRATSKCVAAKAAMIAHLELPCTQRARRADSGSIVEWRR